jgi:hypothetical protein
MISYLLAAVIVSFRFGFRFGSRQSLAMFILYRHRSYDAIGQEVILKRFPGKVFQAEPPRDCGAGVGSRLWLSNDFDLINFDPLAIPV